MPVFARGPLVGLVNVRYTWEFGAETNFEGGNFLINSHSRFFCIASPFFSPQQYVRRKLEQDKNRCGVEFFVVDGTADKTRRRSTLLSAVSREKLWSAATCLSSLH
jgi:hypothetical protein